ncbi:MAG: alpha/beta hydrolase [Betaproteobacteria bacterium RIFCSPLOWO2_12_FULL_65_14]|nr:MAG: alpha/beta hydrolase [Betaproteobacteria bacterium RIFCSPLOWO2_12_FULL_65_14]
MTFKQSFIEVDGCKVNLRRGGSGEPLLFLHGASGAPVIMPFMEKLAARFDVLVPEHPGYGLSDEPEWLENIHDAAYFYLDFLRALDLKNLTLVGSSMGGWIAMEIAVRDTSRIRSLVLVSPAGIAAPGVQPADIFLMAPEEVVRNLFHDPKLAEARLAEPVTPESIDIGLKNRHTTARLAWEPRLHDPFLPKWLHRIDVPVKIVWGREDRILPAKIADELKRLMPKAQMHLLENVGHLPHAEKPDLFCDIVCK